jgi:hypothetical protein
MLAPPPQQPSVHGAGDWLVQSVALSIAESSGRRVSTILAGSSLSLAGTVLRAAEELVALSIRWRNS